MSPLFIIMLIAIMLFFVLHKVQEKFVIFVQAICVFVFLGFAIKLFLTTNNLTFIQSGSWKAPFGITFVVDPLAAIMILVFSLLIFSITIYSFQDVELNNNRKKFYTGLWLLLLGTIGALSTYDIFNLYVWSEVILVSAFIILATTNKNNHKSFYIYAIINIVGTLLMLLGVAFIYGTTGSLNYARIAEHLLNPSSQTIYPFLVLFLMGLGVKGALFPFYFWLPTAYPNTSNSSAMLLASLVTKIIMVVLLRLAWIWWPLHNGYISTLFICIALATMFFGVMGAATNFTLRDILSFHIISQIGYILLAIFVPGKIAIVAAVLFIIHNIFVKTNLLMISAIIESRMKSTQIADLGNLIAANPILAGCFFIAAMSLAGLPPLSGFWAKLLVIKSALQYHYFWSAGVAIVVSLFTLFSMIKIWRFAFSEQGQNNNICAFKLNYMELIALAPLFVLPLMFGLYPHFLMQYLVNIAQQISHPQVIIHTILGANK